MPQYIITYAIQERENRRAVDVQQSISGIPGARKISSSSPIFGHEKLLPTVWLIETSDPDMGTVSDVYDWIFGMAQMDDNDELFVGELGSFISTSREKGGSGT